MQSDIDDHWEIPARGLSFLPPVLKSGDPRYVGRLFRDEGPVLLEPNQDVLE
jgi:hypothetical protein